MMLWDMANLSIVSCVYGYTVISSSVILVTSGGFAVSGLTATSQVGVENVMCPMNATTAADCSFVSPAQSLQCIDGFSSAAGVRCVQGMRRLPP